MARSAKPRKRKPTPQRSKLPRYVVKLHNDDFFDEEDAEVGEHEKPWGNSYAAIADNVPLL